MPNERINVDITQDIETIFWEVTWKIKANSDVRGSGPYNNTNTYKNIMTKNK